MDRVFRLVLVLVLFVMFGFGVVLLTRLFANGSAYNADGRNIERNSTPEQVVSDFVNLARTENYVALKETVAYTPSSYWQYVFAEEKAKNDTKDLNVEENSKEGMGLKNPPTKALDDSAFLQITETLPLLIAGKKLAVKEMVNLGNINGRSRFRVTLTSEINDKFSTVEDFFLFREKSGEWKIFRVAYPSKHEKYPL